MAPDLVISESLEGKLEDEVCVIELSEDIIEL